MICFYLNCVRFLSENRFFFSFSGLSLQLFFKKNFLYLFLNEPALKKLLIFSQKSFFNFQGMELSYILGKVIQNTGIFRTRSMFRTWATFRKLPNIYDGMFSKNRYLVHCLASALKTFLHYRKRNFLSPSLKNILHFKKTSDIAGPESSKTSYVYFQT